MSLKSKVLEILERQRGRYLSGEELAHSLGMSRNAVWKAVEALRRDGHDIDSAPRRGYCLRAASDVLTAEGIAARLPEEMRSLKIFARGSVDSTNNEAKRLLASGEIDGAGLVVADEQTAGRGRQGRSFFSPANTGLYMSLVVRTDASFADAVSLTTMASVAVACAVESLTPLRPQIKWVNDVYVGDRKVCGILTEAVGDFESNTVTNVIIGIGVNISTENFPEELKTRAASLDVELTRSALAAEITARLIRFSQDLTDRGYIEEYRRRSLVIGREITYTVSGETRSARAVGIDESGGLEVLLPNGEHETLRSGEITVRLAPQTAGDGHDREV